MGDLRPDHLVASGAGRVIAVDDVGPVDGSPVVYVHGTPDSRIARHPDDGVAAACGVRLLALDRPGFGHSSVDPRADLRSFAADVAAALDHLGVGRAAVLAWSAGAPWALGVAAALADRVSAVGIAAGTVPFEAYDDPAVAAAAGEVRMSMVEAAREMGAREAAELIGPMLVPDPPTLELAHEHLDGAHDPVSAAELAAVPGATDRMALAVLDSVRQGPEGLVRDVAVAYSPSGVDLASIEVPCLLWYGELDPVCPPAFGRWYGERLPNARLEVLPGAGHAFLLPRWAEVLGALAALA